MKLIIEYLAVYITIRNIIRQIVTFFIRKNNFQIHWMIIITILLSLLSVLIFEFLSYQNKINNIVSFSIAIIIVHGLNYIFNGNKHYLELYKDENFENGNYLKYYLAEFDKYISKISLSVILVNELTNLFP